MNTAYAAGEGGISIHLAPEIIGHLFDIPITNTLLTTWLTMVIIITLTVVVYFRRSLVPNKMQVVAEALIGGVYDYVADVLESKDLARIFFPLIMTIFLFILLMNWIGLLPGVAAFGIYQESHGVLKLVPFLYPSNTDLNITLAFAIISFVVIEIAGVAMLGFLKYFNKFVTFKSPLAFLVGIIELFSEIARLISFSFRLFGNIFAGKTLILIAIFFVPFILPVPLLAFEIFVGFIQAFIFAVLTLFFIKLAMEAPH